MVADPEQVQGQREGPGDEPVERHVGVGLAQAARRTEGKRDPALVGRTLAQQDFPVMLLDLQHHDSVHARLVSDFVSWQAPWQLLLPSLGADARQTFEQDARVQPLKVEQQHRLYPEIIDRKVIDSARVEARLRLTRPQNKKRETVMTTFYIELDPEYAD